MKTEILEYLGTSNNGLGDFLIFKIKNGNNKNNSGDLFWFGKNENGEEIMEVYKYLTEKDIEQLYIDGDINGDEYNYIDYMGKFLNEVFDEKSITQLRDYLMK